jgi:hypothetical protein
MHIEDFGNRPTAFSDDLSGRELLRDQEVIYGY